MKLDKIVNSVRRGVIDELLGDDFTGIDFNKILIYAEHAVSTSTDYRFFKAKRGIEKLIKVDKTYYEHLCSLEKLISMVDLFLSNYNKKTDDILVIEIVDDFDNNNI